MPAEQASVSDLPLNPISEHNRLINIDIIRGVAVLGILLLNIQSFSMIIAAYQNPLAYGDFTGGNQTVYYFTHLFADQKFMTIFATLFGTGIALMAARQEQKGGSARGLHYRRMAILAIIGLIHLYLFWYGDILFFYAIVGMLAFTVRNKTPRFLLISAFFLLLINALLIYLPGFALPYMSDADVHEMMMEWQPTEDLINAEINAFQLSWLEQMNHRMKIGSDMLLNLAFYSFRVLGLMMTGIALYKVDYFGARFSNRSLIIQAILCFCVGCSIILTRLNFNLEQDFPLESILPQENYWGSLLLAYAYMCSLVLFCRTNRLARLKASMANVGKLALTNYLGQTLICTFIFHGWGLGRFGEFDRTEQLLTVLAIWAIQIIFSNSWVKHFQYGPFEWLWRSMTYGKKQPMLRH
jgi:uncharacterized protein